MVIIIPHSCINLLQRLLISLARTTKQIIQITNDEIAELHRAHISIEFPEVNVTTSSSVAELGYFDVFTEECLESRCLVPWSVPVPGGTLLLPVNTESSVRGEGVTLREGRGAGAH